MTPFSRRTAFGAALLLPLFFLVGCNSADESTTVPALSEAPADSDPGATAEQGSGTPDNETQHVASTAGTSAQPPEPDRGVASESPASEKLAGPQTATFGAGCFWCVEAVFELLKGVEKVESGYCNGTVPNPSYEAVCSGLTGHAEVVRVTYDPEVISFAELLEVFWSSHDPTTLNRQGPDTGTQYRSGVYYDSEKQKQTALAYKKKLNDEKAFDNPVVTEIVKAEKFYSAEGYHQDFFNLNPGNGYCRFNIPPKLEKVRKVFADKLKPDDLK